MFYGIIIRMYFAPKEHGLAHIHAFYQDFSAVFIIETCEIEQGVFPPKQSRLVKAWIEIHKDDLLADWNLCQAGERPFKIEPLK